MRTRMSRLRSIARRLGWVPTVRGIEQKARISGFLKLRRSFGTQHCPPSRIDRGWRAVNDWKTLGLPDPGSRGSRRSRGRRHRLPSPVRRARASSPCPHRRGARARERVRAAGPTRRGGASADRERPSGRRARLNRSETHRAVGDGRGRWCAPPRNLGQHSARGRMSSLRCGIRLARRVPARAVVQVLVGDTLRREV
jgi:hypothetical protein